MEPDPTATDVPIRDSLEFRETPPPKRRPRRQREVRDAAPVPTSYRRTMTLGGSVCVIALFTIRMMHASAPSNSAPPPPPPVPAGASEAALRRHYGLVARPRFDAFEVSDGAGRMTITLPAQPQIDAQVMTDHGVRAFVAVATVRDGTRVIRAGVIGFADGAGPSDGLELAEQFARASEPEFHGTIERDETGALAGQPARIVELRLPDDRRLLSWYVADAANACLYQVHCIDRNSDELRHACTAIAQSLTIAPLR